VAGTAMPAAHCRTSARGRKRFFARSNDLNVTCQTLHEFGSMVKKIFL
jgi:hypothetical protein